MVGCCRIHCFEKRHLKASDPERLRVTSIASQYWQQQQQQQDKHRSVSGRLWLPLKCCLLTDGLGLPLKCSCFAVIFDKLSELTCLMTFVDLVVDLLDDLHSDLPGEFVSGSGPWG